MAVVERGESRARLVNRQIGGVFVRTDKRRPILYDAPWSNADAHDAPLLLLLLLQVVVMMVITSRPTTASSRSFSSSSRRSVSSSGG